MVCCSLRPLMDALRSALPASEVAKLELRDEAEFIILRLNTASRHVKHSLHMYSRDAIHCVREGEDGIARQLLAQKLMMERRADSIKVNLELLESVRTSLQPGLPRCRGDMATCRTILDRCHQSCMAPEVITFMDMCTPVLDAADTADDDPSTPLNDRVASQAVDEEFERLKSTVQKPFLGDGRSARESDSRDDDDSGAMDSVSHTERADLLLLPRSPATWTDRDLAAAAAANSGRRAAILSSEATATGGDGDGALWRAGPAEGVLVQLDQEDFAMDTAHQGSEQQAAAAAGGGAACGSSTTDPLTSTAAADGTVAQATRGSLPTARQLVFDKQR